MNIALFASAFYPYVGGVEEHCRQVAHELMRQGHRAIVLTNRWPRSMAAYEEYEGIPVYRLAFRAPEGSAKARVTYAVSTRLIRRETNAILRRNAIDVLHVHCVSANAYYARAAKEALGLPLVVTTHGEVTMDATGVFQRSAFMNRVLRDAIESAEAVTACSRRTLEELESHIGTTAGPNKSVVYNGICPDDFAVDRSYTHSRPFILGIGRLVKQKGFDVLLRAYAALPMPPADLLIAGDGPECEALKALAMSLRLDSRVHFVGRADRSTAIALFQGCQFFVLPSRLEPMGIVNLEAMAAGKAVIASNVGGVPEVVLDGETGLLVPPEEPTALAASMSRLLADWPLRDRLGAAGRVRAAGFTWQATVREYLGIYERCAVREMELV